MKLKVDKKELLAAVEKAAVGCKETFRITVSKNKSTDGKSMSSISSCNGIVRTNATFFVKAEEPVSFIVGVELIEVLRAVGEFGDEYTIEVNDTTVVISSGSALMPLSLKKEDPLFQIQTPKNDKCIMATFDREDFIKSVRQGSYAYGGDNDSLKNSVALQPVLSGETKKLNLFSSDGRLAVRASATVLEANEEFQEALDSFVSIDAPTLRGICSKFESEKINVMIFSKQISFKDGNDIYTIVRYEAAFPGTIGKFLDEEGYNFKAKFDTATLRAAIKVATILEDAQNKVAVIDICNGKVTISSKLGKNKAEVIATDIEGEIKIAVNARHFERTIAEIGSEKITISGLGDLKPVYITANTMKVLTTPIKQ